MIKCIVVDDEQSAIDVLTQHIQASGQLHLTHATTNPLEALRIINEQSIDIAFLDIKMPGITGLELASAIQGKCKVIFTTGYSEFVSEAFDMDDSVVDYLLKPIPLVRFIRAVERAIKKIAPAQPSPFSVEQESLEHDYLFVRNEQKGKMTRVMLAHIDYVQAMRKQVIIYHAGQVTVAQLGMKELEERLPARHFLRVQKSYIVAIQKIDTVEGNSLQIKGFNKPIAIGDMFKASFMETMQGKLAK